jgi:hypothetical protein
MQLRQPNPISAILDECDECRLFLGLTLRRIFLKFRKYRYQLRNERVNIYAAVFQRRDDPSFGHQNRVLGCLGPTFLEYSAEESGEIERLRQITWYLNRSGCFERLSLSFRDRNSCDLLTFCLRVRNMNGRCDAHPVIDPASHLTLCRQMYYHL